MVKVNEQPPDESRAFRQMLSRNVALPLFISLITAAGLIGLVVHLLNTARAVDHTNHVISEIATLQRLMVDTETGLRGYLITGDRTFLEPKIKADQDLTIRVPRLRALVSENSMQLRRIERFEAELAAWSAYFDDMEKLRTNGGDYVAAVRTKRGKALTDSIRNIFADMQDTEAQLRDERNVNAKETTKTILSVGIAVLLLFGVIIALSGRRQLIALSDRFTATVASQREQNTKLERLNWIRTGQTRLSDEFHGAADLGIVCDRSMAFVGTYIGAAVGRLFLAQERGGFLAVSGYALPASALREPGEGWVTQAAMGNRVVTLPELPENYLQLKSGLGKTSVSHVLVAPMISDGVVRAVVEFGFLKAPSDDVVDLLTQSSDKLGSAIASAQSRARLQDLLDETQRQAEELQSQQEELEANNEDLHQKSQELLAQQHNLEQVNEELQQQQSLMEEQQQRLELTNADLRQAQTETKEKARNLEIAGKYKSEFLANMSHELRTPLNSILLLSNLLTENQKTTMTGEEIEYASTIHASAIDLLSLINEILDLSKVEAGKLDLVLQQLQPMDLAPALERTFRPAMSKKGLKFEVTYSKDIPTSIITDRTRCEQVLRNFLSNALKFTERGSITLAFTKPQSALYALSIEVRDTGIGIPQQKQAIVFEAFQQADGTISRRFGGTGLGLTISRELASLLGGKLELESTEGHGSIFRLLLPSTIKSGGTVAVPSAVEPPLDEKSIETVIRTNLGGHDIEDDRQKLKPGQSLVLVIEDDPTFAKAFCKLCRAKGYHCLIAADGETGLAEAIHFSPAAIFLDLNLPGVSGVGVLEALKRNPTTRHIPVHVVSVETDGRDVLKRGAVGFRSKPIDEASISRLIDDVMRAGTTREKRLLVVEDNSVEQENIRRLIDNGDVISDIVGTGKAALEKLREVEFDCVILDLKLPDMNGFDFLAEMEKLALRRKPPVIVYTARDLTREEQARLSEVSQSIVLKGARSPERLLDELTLFLHQMEDRLSPAQKEMLQRVRHRDDLYTGKKLLLVDDDMRNVFALRSVLLTRGFEIVVAKSGKEALERLEQTPDVSLILMDVMMPEMDGYEAIAEIRKQERFRQTPIIALTAKAMKGDRQRCLEAGANDYLPKPVELPSLLSLLRIWLTK